jgi:cytidylate kinase
MTAAPDAVLIDTTGIGIDEVVAQIEQLAAARANASANA